MGSTSTVVRRGIHFRLLSTKHTLNSCLLRITSAILKANPERRSVLGSSLPSSWCGDTICSHHDYTSQRSLIRYKTHRRSQDILRSRPPNSQDTCSGILGLSNVGVLHHGVESVLKTIGEPLNSIEISPPSTVLCQKPIGSIIQLVVSAKSTACTELLPGGMTLKQQP